MSLDGTKEKVDVYLNKTQNDQIEETVYFNKDGTIENSTYFGKDEVRQRVDVYINDKISESIYFRKDGTIYRFDT